MNGGMYDYFSSTSDTVALTECAFLPVLSGTRHPHVVSGQLVGRLKSEPSPQRFRQLRPSPIKAVNQSSCRQ
jgi:hypothetical protein